MRKINLKQKNVSESLQAIRERVSEVIVGNEKVIDTLIFALFSEGHVLLEGMPGIGKTTLAKTFSQAVGGDFKRVQMTPDLLPADVIGTEIFEREKSDFRVRKGPIFSNFVLADELNRATPKLQSAFLEAMQERQVTIGNETFRLERPFMVVATQIPYGRSGTYPLTEVQIDRFAFKVPVDYPNRDEEREVLSRSDKIEDPDVDPVINLEDCLKIVDKAESVYVDEKVRSYIVDIVSQVRERREVESGPSARASIWLYKGSRVKALAEDRDYVIPDDVKYLVPYTIPQRVQLTAEAEAGETSPMDIVEEELEEVEVPKGIRE